MSDSQLPKFTGNASARAYRPETTVTASTGATEIDVEIDGQTTIYDFLGEFPADVLLAELRRRGVLPAEGA